MDQSSFQKHFLAIAGCGAGVLLVLVWVFIKGDLSSRGFAVAVLIWWIAMFAVFFQFIRSRQRAAEDAERKQIASGVPPEEVDRDRCIRNIRSMKRLIAVFAILLGYGLVSSQGAPPLSRTMGAAVDVLLVAVCVHSLVRSQKRLKGLPADRARSSSDMN
jgi:hypothetical protein